MKIALDLGSHTFRSLRAASSRSVGDHLIARRMRAVYLTLPDSDTHRRLLEKTGTMFLACDHHLVLIGEPALEISRLLQVPTQDLLPRGQLAPHDPISRQIINLLVDALLPQSTEGGICCFTHTGAMRRSLVAAQMDFFSRLIRLRGYTPLSLPAGQALILAELVRERFTGIGLVIGATGCEVTVSQLGQELHSWTIPRGGRWIDEQLARERGDLLHDTAGHRLLDLEKASMDKEALSRALTSPGNRDEKLLARLCRELAWEIAGDIGQKLAEDPRLASLTRPVHLVCGGGLAQIPGFFDLLQEALERRDTPVPIDRILIADSSPYTIARGLLVHAELESQQQTETRPSRAVHAA